MRSLGHDLRLALRSLSSSRSHAALAVFMLAVGIGVNAAVFSIVDSVLIRPVPFKDAERYVELWNKQLQSQFIYSSYGSALMKVWRDQTDVIDRFEAHDIRSYVLSAGDGAEMVPGAAVTPGLLGMLGIEPVAGRTFVDGEGRPGADEMVVISGRLWRSHFGADPSIVGRHVTINDTPHRVVGVMPEDFYFPNARQELWTPIDVDTLAIDDKTIAMTPYVRLRAGLSYDAARAMVEARGEALNDAAGGRAGIGATLGPHGFVSNDARRSLYVLLGAVGFLLLIVCANLANLSLSRALSRARDVAIRSSLGASRWRLVRESLAESAVIATAGALAGIGIAYAMLALTLAWLPSSMTFSSLNAIDLDARALLFTIAVAASTVFVVGLPPALAGSRPAVNEMLKGDSRSSAGSRPARRLRAGLVVAEVGLSIVLLVGAALMTRSFLQLHDHDRGFDADGLLTMQVGLPTRGYVDPDVQEAFSEQLIERLEAAPGVTSATGGSAPPGSAGISFGRIEFEGRPQATDETIMASFVVWPNYFATIGLPIVDGRTFADADEEGAVIVAEGFARAQWPGASALGKRFRWQGRSNARWYTVVGVAADVWLGDDEARIPHELYYPMRRAAGAVARPARPSGAIADWRTFTVRTTTPGLTVPALRSAVAGIDPRVVVSSIDAVDHLYAEDLAMPRLMLLLMATFAAFGLLVAAAGIYGVLSHLVTERRREFGVRVALGARPVDIRRLVLRSAAVLTGAGIGLGLIVSTWTMRFVRALLYEVEATDPVSLAAVALLLGAISGVAAWRPTHRAMRADPLTLLRDG